jgi:hypothetical protein
MKRKKNKKKDDKNNRTQQKMVGLRTLGQALGLRRMGRGLVGRCVNLLVSWRLRRFAVLDLASSAIVTGGSAVDENLIAM